MRNYTEEQKARKAVYDAEYREKNKEKRRQNALKYYHENKERFKQKYQKRVHENKPAFEAIRTRCKNNGIPFDLTLEYLNSITPERCPVFNTLLSRSSGTVSASSPSVDRIDPSKGYVIGNVQVISNKANMMKSNATEEELIAFATWIFKLFNKELT